MSEMKKSPSSLSQRRKKFAWLVPLADLRITLTLLSLSMVLIFVATLEQVRIGIRGAQAEFFESIYGMWNYPCNFGAENSSTLCPFLYPVDIYWAACS